MGQLYEGAREQLREDGEVSVLDRTFRVALMGPNPRPDFDAAHTTMDEVFAGESRNYRDGDVAARLQVIGDPSQPFGVRDRLYQFFVEEGSRDRARRLMGPAVLYERTEEGEVPLALLSRDDLNSAVSGEGFTIAMPYEPGEPEAAPRAAQDFAGTPTGETDKDGNSVPDVQEYVDGDPDKGIKAGGDIQKVQVVSEEDIPTKPTVPQEPAKQEKKAADKKEPAKKSSKK